MVCVSVNIVIISFCIWWTVSNLESTLDVNSWLYSFGHPSVTLLSPPKSGMSSCTDLLFIGVDTVLLLWDSSPRTQMPYFSYGSRASREPVHKRAMCWIYIPEYRIYVKYPLTPSISLLESCISIAKCVSLCAKNKSTKGEEMHALVFLLLFRRLYHYSKSSGH